MKYRMWREDNVGAFPNATAYHYEGGGGGNKGETAMMMMQMQQQQQDRARQAVVDEQNRQRAEQAAIDEKNRIAQEKADAQVRAQGNLQKTLGSARNYGTMQNAQYGGDDRYGLLSLYNSLLGNAESSIPEGDPNPSSYINANDLWSQAQTTQRGTQRNSLQKQARDLYDYGFETRAIADEMDDPILQSILGDQTTEARANLDRSRARGQLNDEAYGYAQTALGQQSAAANNTLQSLGGTVLQRYRDSLLNRQRNLNQRVTDWDFGDDIDFDRERSGYEADLNKDRGALEGDVRSAIGDRELFNMDLLLGKARSRAGTTNTPAANPLVGAFASTPSTAISGTGTTDDQTKRNVGVF